MNPTDQERLDTWLRAARAGAEQSENEASGAAGGEGVLDLVERKRRGKHLQFLAEQIRQVPLARSKHARGRWFAWSAAAALVLAVGSGVGLWQHHQANAIAVVPHTESPATQSTPTPSANLRQVVGKVVSTRADGQDRVVAADTQIALGEELSTTADAFASLEAGRARVDLSAATTLLLAELEPTSKVFKLQAGRVDVSVPKVPGEEQLIQVTTHDTTVTVHGTVFSVEVLRSDTGPVTNVGVTRGLVSVERKGVRVMLHPGESWSSRPASAAAVVNPASAGVSPAPDSPVAAKGEAAQRALNARPNKTRRNASPLRAPSVAQNSASEADRSRLAEQNRLFELAMRARDRGKDAQVVTQLRHLLTNFPDSPLESTVQSELSAARKRLAEAGKAD